MSEYFGKYIRPKTEIKRIEAFIKIFNESRVEYKHKKYEKSLSGFITGYEILKDIFDFYPKVVTLNLIIKCQFRLAKYDECKSSISEFKQYLPNLIKYKKESFIKYKPKIFLYEFILDFIFDNLDESLLHITEFISYLKNTNILTLEEKTDFFWVFIKNFVKIGENLKSRNFLFFKQQYNSMIIEENKLKSKYENIMIKEKKILRGFVYYYKTFMNSKLKQLIYENLDEKFYFYKYGEVDNRIIDFLHRNMELYIQGGNKEILTNDFENYLLISNIDINKQYNMNINQLLYEQKKRVKYFDSAFLNIVGAFNNIFKNSLTEKEISLKPLQNSNSVPLILAKKDIQQMEQKLIKKMKIIKPNLISRNKNVKNKNMTMPDLAKEIKVPQPCNLKLKKSKKSKLLYFSRAKYKTIFNSSYRITFENDTTKLSNNNNKSALPILNNRKELILKEINKNKLVELKNKLLYEKILYRRINYFLIYKISEIYEKVIDENNGNSSSNNYLKEKLSLKNNFIELNISNYIKENGFYKLKEENNSGKMRNNLFIFKKVMMINNFTLFGLCESSGNCNEKISKMFSLLFPTFLTYLLFEFVLLKEKKDFEKLIGKLFLLEESINKIKHIFLLSYINDKLKINYKYFPFITEDISIISNILFQALYYTIKEIIQKYHYEFDKNGINFCAMIILGKTIYILNIGNIKALIGNNKYNSNYNWEYKLLSFNRKNKTNKKLVLSNNKDLNTKEELKKDNSDIIYNLKLTNKESILIGQIYDDIKGIKFEQEVVKYEFDSKDKFIIIGSEGFWKYMDNDVVVDFIAKYYNNGVTAEEVSKLLVEMAKDKWDEEIKQNQKKGYRKLDKIGDNYFLDYDEITCIVIYLDIR